MNNLRKVCEKYKIRNLKYVIEFSINEDNIPCYTLSYPALLKNLI